MVSKLLLVAALCLVLDECFMISALPVTAPLKLIKRKDMELPKS
jgi:hypothetical protein